MTGGTKGTFSGSGSSYTLVVTPVGSDSVTVTVAANAAEDGAGNTGPASAASATAAWDATAPTLDIGGVPSEVIAEVDFTASFDFSEAVTGFAASDVTVTGGAKGAFAGSDSSYTLVVTPAGTGDVTVEVAANAAVDGAGNTGPASAVSATALKDTTAPTVEIVVPSEVGSADFTAGFEFSEAVTGFAAFDVTVTGGAKGAFAGSDSSYTLVVTPAGTVDVTVEVAANAAEDGAGNTGPASAVSATALNPALVTVVPDTLSMGESATGEYQVGLSRAPSSGTVTVTVTSGDSTAVAVSSEGGWVGSTALEFTAVQWRPRTVQVLARPDEDAVSETVTIGHTVTSTTDANYSNLTAPPAVVEVADDDSAAVIVSPREVSVGEGRTNGYFVSLAAEPVDSVTVTITSPDPAVTVAVGSDGVHASSAVLNFSADDYSTARYVTVRAVEDSDGDDETVTLSHVASGSSLDYDGVTVPDVVVNVSDTTVPTLEIGVPSGINSTAAFTASFEFSEAVTGFAVGDVTVTGGTKGTFSGSGSSYTLVVTPAGSADVTVEVAADAAKDGGDNPAPASAVSATAVWDVTAPTVEIVVRSEVIVGVAFTAGFEFSEAVTGVRRVRRDGDGWHEGRVRGERFELHPGGDAGGDGGRDGGGGGERGGGRRGQHGPGVGGERDGGVGHDRSDGGYRSAVRDQLDGRLHGEFRFFGGGDGVRRVRRDGDGWRERDVFGERLELHPGGDADGDGERDGGGGGERGGGRRGQHGPGVGGERDGAEGHDRSDGGDRSAVRDQLGGRLHGGFRVFGGGDGVRRVRRDGDGWREGRVSRGATRATPWW